MKTLVIDRTKWRRGGDAPSLARERGGTYLLNDINLMCCLGFDALACGISRDAIFERADPAEIVANSPDCAPDSYAETRIASREGGNSNAVTDAITVNDMPGLTDAQREAKLVPLLKQLGWDAVEFVN